MVARITYGKNIVGVLEYNKLKVDKETAGVLCCHKLPVMPLDGKIDFHKLVEAFAPHLSDPRSRLSDPVFHASLNPHPEDRLSDARLIEIAHEYMERMGYGDQPFVVFKHEDIARSHLHIVSICIGPDGKTIDRYNDRKLSQEITRELERQYGLHSSQGERPVFEELRRVDYRAGNVRAQVASVVRSMTDRYRFASAGELNTLLRPFNVWLEECRGEARGRTYEGVLYGALDASGERIGNPIPASRIGRDVGYDALQKQYAATKSWIRENRERLEPTKEAIRQAMRQCRTPEEFAEAMRRAGVSVRVPPQREERREDFRRHVHRSRQPAGCKRLAARQSVFGEQLREAVRAGRGRNPEYGKRKLTCQSQDTGTNPRQASAAKRHNRKMAVVRPRRYAARRSRSTGSL